RDLDILTRIAAGHTNREIAEHLHLSEDTIKQRLRKLYPRLGARDRAHAVAICYLHGILGTTNDTPSLPLRLDDTARLITPLDARLALNLGVLANRIRRSGVRP
ncbi:MAG: helix-turn-helix transcriptional regulator, partial [Pseudonocardia sp.]|nr:helix-turn-helix transcriptional regulator [Pseudonocardia sp.]